MTRKELAMKTVREFLQKMEELGIGRDEAMKLL